MNHEHHHDHNCSCGCQNEKKFEALDSVLDEYANVAGSLITILQKAQECYGYLSPDLMLYISQMTATPVAKIYGVATFYTQFRLKPIGKHLIMLCQGTACHVNGSKLIEEAVFEHLGIKEGETTGDGLFTVENVACLGCCSLSPVMMIDNETYGQLTKEKAVNIINEIKSQEA
ncbi:MAG: NADH-quinone oxidoreductase subunit NuoE [Eubacterium sp.]